MFKALPKTVVVKNIEKGERMVGSVLLLDDNGKHHGVRSRWAEVYSVGDGIEEVKEGEWVLIMHGRWTRGYEIDDETTIYRIDYPHAVLAVSDEKVFDTFISDSMAINA